MQTQIMKQKGHLRIGTSNTTIPGNKSTFPLAFQLKSRLHYYASIFNTVEINSSFYKTPQFTTYHKWALDVPDDFQFTLKLSKQITHSKNITVDIACMVNFLKAAYGTGKKKGCLLIQFPGKITLDDFSKVEDILHQLQEYDLNYEWRKAVEFRNTTWYIGEVLEMLADFGASMVLHDHPKAKNFDIPPETNFIYIRYHGPKGNYRDSYSDDFLKYQAQKIREWVDNGKDVYAYFNNTIGNAYENALYLKSLLGNI